VWPGATNTITVTLKSNIDLKGSDHANITLSMVENPQARATGEGAFWGAPLTVSDYSASTGIACDTQALEGVQVYVMYSHQEVRERFGDHADPTSLSKFICVMYHDDTWLFSDKIQNLQPFTPLPTDILVAEVNTTAVMPKMTGSPEIVHGIVLGYKGGDATFVFVEVADRQSGLYNGHGIGLVGDFLVPHFVALSDVGSNPFASIVGIEFPGQAETVSDPSYAMVLRVRNDETMLSGVLYSFSFQVLNSLQSPALPSPRIRADTTCAEIQDAEFVGDVLNIDTATFVAKFIEQSKPFPATLNQITVALKANVHFKGAMHPSLTISGLSGARPRLTDDSNLDIFDGSGGGYHNEKFENSEGSWRQDSQAVVVKVAPNKNLIAGREYRFVFEVYNPAVTVANQYVLPPAAMTDVGHESMQGPLSASSPDLNREEYFQLRNRPVTGETSVEMDDVRISAVYFPATPDGSPPKTLDELMMTMQTSLALCANTHDLDRTPMFLYKPRFTVAKLEQTSAFPCDEGNHIKVTLQTNVPLCAKESLAQITISNLGGAVHEDGDVVLSGLGDGTDHLTFSAYPGGPGGHGLWSNSGPSAPELILFLTCLWNVANPMYLSSQ